VEAVGRCYHYYGHDFRVERPTGSGRLPHLGEVAHEINERLAGLFRAEDGARPCQGPERRFARGGGERPWWPARRVERARQPCESGEATEELGPLEVDKIVLLLRQERKSEPRPSGSGPTRSRTVAALTVAEPLPDGRGSDGGRAAPGRSRL